MALPLGPVEPLLRERLSRVPAPDGMRWVPGALHVTLVFLGETEVAHVPMIIARIREIAARHRTLRLRLRGAGTFGGGRRPRVAWVGLERSDRLHALAQELDAALRLDRAGGLERAVERLFRPHVTVARRAPDGLAGAIHEALDAGPELSWEADAIVLYRSHLRSDGSRYELIGRAALRPGGAPMGDEARS